jgi:hypothetical protein
LHAPCYPASIDLAMLSNTIPPNSTQLLHRWRVMEAVARGDIRTRHVCGQNPNGSFGISTSAIQEFDPDSMTVKTLSGKTYILVGSPDKSSLGQAAWRKWCNDNGIAMDRDVTSEYFNADQESSITFKRVGFRHGANS